MNDEKYTELTRKAYKNEDADLIVALNYITELKAIIGDNIQKQKIKDEELEESFNDFVRERDQNKEAFLTALKMYRNPDKARSIFIEVYGDFDNDG